MENEPFKQKTERLKQIWIFKLKMTRSNHKHIFDVLNLNQAKQNNLVTNFVYTFGFLRL